jgi:hypothetical protein
VPWLYKNCTNLHKVYPHGVGRVGARDKTSGTPVTTFWRSAPLYRLAMSYNRRLDRDQDGIACEKASTAPSASPPAPGSPRSRRAHALRPQPRSQHSALSYDGGGMKPAFAP